MEWYFVLIAVVLGVPIILFPVALVWYLNVSGLYQVLRDVRQRQRRRAEALKEAERLIQAKTTAATAPEQGALAGKG
jgi:heme exporter protein D